MAKPTPTTRTLGGGMLCFLLVLPGAAAAQQMPVPAPDRDQRFGVNRISVEIGIVAVTAGYARQMSEATEFGFAVSGGAQAGLMLWTGELTGRAPSLFAELLGGSVFVRRGVGDRTELEAGLRAGWLYHSTEYETRFRGAYATLRHRFGAARIGPSVYLGQLSEESGRREVGFALVPLTAAFRWSW